MKFKTVFIPVLIVCLLLLAVSLYRSASFDDAHAERTLENTLSSTYANTEGLSLAERQQAMVFHQQAQLALLDDAKQILAQSGEFLVLRDRSTPKMIMLPDLSEKERSTIYNRACKDEDEAMQMLERATAFEYEAYPYGSIVYPQSVYGVESSVAVEKELIVYASPLESGLYSGSMQFTNDEIFELSAWVPYLRSSEPDTERFAELLGGAEPVNNLFTREQFQLRQAPEGLGAQYLAVYRVSHPLSDFWAAHWGDFLIGLFLSVCVSAALSLGICSICDRLRKKQPT